MVGAIYTGMYGDGAKFDVKPTCSSGNCTWDQEYTSLGFCSKCYDTTDQIIKQCGSYDYTTTDENNNTIVVGEPIQSCNYSLPSLFEPQTIPGVDFSTGAAISPIPIFVDINAYPASNETYFGKPLTAHVATLSVMRAAWNQTTDNVGDNYRNWYSVTNVNASECGIDVCAIKYRANSVKSIFNETVVDTFINTTDSLIYSDGDSGYTMPAVIHPPSSWTNHSETGTGNIFTMDSLTIQALRMQFVDSANQRVWSGRFNDSMVGQVSVENDFVAYVRFLNETGMKNMMNSLTSAMTRRIRTAPGEGTNAAGPGPVAVGQTTQLLPHVNVRWGWITLPTTLLILSALLLILTMITTTKTGATMLWKGNALAHFYHPLTKEARTKFMGAESAKHAEKIARDMRVKWEEREEGGGRFVPVDSMEGEKR
jgi:hypothetical protein